MFDFHEKRKIRNIVYSKPSIVVLFVLGMCLSMSAYTRFTVEREMAAKRFEKVEELELQHTRTLQLEAEVTHLQDERGIEEELRNRFDVMKEGEQMVVIVDESVPEVDAGTTTSESTLEQSQSLWEMFKFW